LIRQIVEHLGRENSIHCGLELFEHAASVVNGDLVRNRNIGKIIRSARDHTIVGKRREVQSHYQFCAASWSLRPRVGAACCAVPHVGGTRDGYESELLAAPRLGRFVLDAKTFSHPLNAYRSQIPRHVPPPLFKHHGLRLAVPLESALTPLLHLISDRGDKRQKLLR
jgi:hypothetical protein